MSVHRYLCNAEAPAGGDHQHACIHDAARPPTRDLGRMVEHKCQCGLIWTLPEWQPRPPPDTSWLDTPTPKHTPWWKRVTPQGKWHPFGPI